MTAGAGAAVAPPQRSYSLVVKSSVNGEQLARISPWPDMSLLQLKEAIVKMSRVPVFQQQLMMNDKVLHQASLSRLLKEGMEETADEHGEVIIRLVKDLNMQDPAGTHLSSSCTCALAADEVCWGYDDTVKDRCPRCKHKITSKRTMECRYKGDAYGWIRLKCQECGLTQKHGWDDAD
mmetsp:Transcript_8369/g.15246  ORF Transcript_8369/g.15246 Transcript_8369/m.15246 type:complete len:178 (-) Transcript_8369:23-556(-)